MIKEDIIKAYQDRFSVKKFIPGVSLVPISGKVFDEQEFIKMIEAVLDGWWTEGVMTKDFEQKLAEYISVKFCSAVNSGSSANLLAIMALTSHLLRERRLKKGDEIITLAAGFPTTVNPIIQAGCIPVFIDLEFKTLSANEEELKKAINKKTRAVFFPHTLGNPFNIEAVKKVCKENNLWLIEDNCDALGSLYMGEKTGSFGDISTLSFYPAHHITTIEGGAVFTNNPILHKAVRSLRDWGRDCWCPTGKDDTCGKRFKRKLGELPYGYDHKYIYSHIGYNLKMTEIQAACGLAQIKKLPEFIKKRQENYAILKNGLEEFGQYFSIVEATEKSEPSWFGFPINIKNLCGFTREDLLEYLNRRKIGTRLLFAGNITKQPYFINYKVKHKVVGDLKNTDYVMTNTFWLGVYPGLNEEMLKYVIESFQKFFD